MLLHYIFVDLKSAVISLLYIYIYIYIIYIIYIYNVVALISTGLYGRLVKLFLFSTLLHKSPLTSIYFATFEKKREVMSPLPTQSKFLVFGNIYIYIYI